jgi:signal transduction histidine kinase
MGTPSASVSPADGLVGTARASGNRLHRWLAWSVWFIALVALSSFIPTLVDSTVLDVAEAGSWTAGVMAVATIGALVVSRQRSLIQGWLLVGFSLALSIGFYAYHFLRLPDADLSALDEAQRLIAIGDSAFVISTYLLVALLLVVPNGKLPSSRWRPMVWVLAASVLGMVLITVWGANGVEDVEAWLGRTTWMSNSGKALNPLEETLFPVASAFALTIVGLDAAALWSRLRSARGEERQQVKWVVWGCSSVLVWFVVWQPQPSGGWLAAVQRLIPGLALLLLATGFGMALFKYRLWDIDLVMRRSLVYGVLWLLIAGAYLGVATTFGLVAGARFPIEVAIVLTVAATLVFQPARNWLERLADRWVFGRRDSPAEALHQFGEGVATSRQPGTIASELATAATRALVPAWVEVDIDGLAPMTAGEPNDEPEVTVHLAWGEEAYGWIRCQPHHGAKFDRHDIALLEALAAQAALALSHRSLASRIVKAEERERRRIERNIHDGAQQDLATLVARLGVTRTRMDDDSALAQTLDDIRGEVQRILADLRELAQGIHPSVLRDGGLMAAIEDRCSRLPLDVKLTIDSRLSQRRFPAEVETAAYFFTAEALANTLKHSDSVEVSVAVRLDDSRLRVEVVDSGKGFDPTAPQEGSGIKGLSDRIRAVGGRITVDSAQGRGVALVAELPIEKSS